MIPQLFPQMFVYFNNFISNIRYSFPRNLCPTTFVVMSAEMPCDDKKKTNIAMAFENINRNCSKARLNCFAGWRWDLTKSGCIEDRQ